MRLSDNNMITVLQYLISFREKSLYVIKTYTNTLSLVKKQAKNPPQKYQHEEDPVLGLLHIGIFMVDGSLRKSFDTGW